MKSLLHILGCLLVTFGVHAQLYVSTGAGLYIADGGVVTVSSTNVTLNNDISGAGSGRLLITGTTQQQLNNSGYAVWGLEVNNTSGAIINGNLNVQGPLTLTNGALLVNGNILTASNTITCTNGTLSGSTTSSFVVATSSGDAGTVNFLQSSTGNFFNNLTINCAGAVTLGNTVKVAGTLTLTAGRLNTGGNLILTSTADSTAMVAQVTGATINGTVTVERYIPAHRAWRLLTAPLSQTGAIYNNWQNGGVADDTTGVVIFKPHANGADGYTAGGNEASMEYYDEMQDNWFDVANTNVTSLGNNKASAANHAYSLFITGPYGANATIASGAQPTTLRVSGLLQTGPQTFTYTPGKDHYILTGNPYASPVDLANVVNNATGVYQQFWTWDPNRSGTSVGGYVTFTWNGTSYVNDMTGQTLQTTVLQSGEAFFTQANTTGTVSIPFTEADKTNASTSTNGVFFAPMPDASSLLRVALNKNISNTMTPVDGVLSLYNSGYKKDATDDAAKLYNYDENLSIRISDNYIAIQKAPLPKEGDSLWLDVYAMKANSNYSFTLTPQKLPNTLQAWIVDKYLNTKTPVDLTATSDITFTTTADKTSYSETRFVVVFATQGALASTLTNVKAWQQDKNIQVEWTTATEQGIQQYVAEKSNDGASFKQTGLAVTPRNTGKTEVYDLTDNDPVTGDNYYRIKVITKDAATAYSNVVMVKILKGKPAFTVSPNPVQKSQQLHVTYANMEAGKYALILYGNDCKKVLQRSVTLDGTSTTQTINLPLSLATATYRLVLMDEKGHSWSQQVIVD